MIATTRLLTLSTLLAMIFGLMLVHQAGAKPINAHPSTTIEQRVENFRNRCMDEGDGQTFSVKYENDAKGQPTKATTKCKGGAYNGFNCTFTKSTTECWYAFMPGQQTTSPHAPVGGGALENVQVTPAPINGNPGDGTLATPEASPAPRVVVVAADRATVVQTDDEDE
jgi:hypothetical protein